MYRMTQAGRSADRVGRHERAFDQAAELVESITVPDPFSVRQMLNNVVRLRAKPIVLHKLSAEWGGVASWCGAWVDTDAADHIFFVEDRSTVKTAGTVLHEIGHVLFDHPGQPLSPSMPLIDLALSEVVRARGRSAFDAQEELAAEAFATLVLQTATFRGKTDLSLPGAAHASLLELRLG